MRVVTLHLATGSPAEPGQAQQRQGPAGSAYLQLELVLLRSAKRHPLTQGVGRGCTSQLPRARATKGLWRGEGSREGEGSGEERARGSLSDCHLPEDCGLTGAPQWQPGLWSMEG